MIYPYFLFLSFSLVCSNPPEVAGIIFKPKIRQSQNVYYIGDIVTATCDMFGEELVAGHSGDIECLASGYWSPRKPACKSKIKNVVFWEE